MPDFYKSARMNDLMTLLSNQIRSHLDANDGFSNRWHARELGERIMDRLDAEGWIKIYD